MAFPIPSKTSSTPSSQFLYLKKCSAAFLISSSNLFLFTRESSRAFFSVISLTTPLTSTTFPETTSGLTDILSHLLSPALNLALHLITPASPLKILLLNSSKSPSHLSTLVKSLKCLPTSSSGSTPNKERAFRLTYFTIPLTSDEKITSLTFSTNRRYFFSRSLSSLSSLAL